jgi:histidinol-phosphate aminotransferase
MPPEPRPELRHIADVPHGALDFAELERLGLAPQDVLDFSVNGNLYGLRRTCRRYSPAYRSTVILTVMPWPCVALSAHLDVPLEGILGNGSVELLWLTALAFLRPDDAVLIVGPTFGEYARAAALMGTQHHSWTAQPEEAFRINPEAVLQTLQRLAPRLVFLCNPNNPTGTYLVVDTIMAWAAALPQTLLVIDEAYLPFASGAASVIGTRCANLLVLRSMTKAHALAGVRLGYAVGHPQVIRALALVRPPWNVNALAQAAGIAALHDQAHVTHTLAQLRHAKDTLLQKLDALNLVYVPSYTHFFLLHVGEAMACRKALLQHGILVRDCTSFGLPEYIRVATRRAQENDRLLAALAQVR